MIGVRIEGRGAFLKVATDAAALEQAIRAEIRKLAGEYQRQVASLLARTGTGRVYRRSASRGMFTTRRETVTVFGGAKRRINRRVAIAGPAVPTYRASAPLDPPAQFTGNMARSLRAVFPARDKGFGAKVKTARFFHRQLLEFGTGRYRLPGGKGGRSKGASAKTHMKPRPIWSPLQPRVEEALEQRLLAAIDATIAARGGS